MAAFCDGGRYVEHSLPSGTLRRKRPFIGRERRFLLCPNLGQDHWVSGAGLETLSFSSVKEELMNPGRARAVPLALIVFVLAGPVFDSAVEAQSPGEPLVLPVEFVGNRFCVRPIAVDGRTLRFYTDSGGGLFIVRAAVDRLGLAVKEVGEEEQKVQLVVLPEFKPDASIPAPLSRDGMIPIWAPPPEDRGTVPMNADGILGQEWFAGRVWTFDYPNGRLLLRSAGDVPAHDPKHEIALGFQADASGKRGLNFPRIQAVIDAETIDFLLDTGATTAVSDEAVAVIRDQGAAERATSFITDSVFRKWHTRHPEWRVIEKAEKGTGQAMIEVPSVAVAGHKVGSVWFTRRADANFHEFMSQFMDKPVEGALGGNLLCKFRLTVDYPDAIAIFEK